MKPSYPPVGVERVAEDGEAGPPVRQHELHAALLPRPAAPEVEDEDGDERGAGHEVRRDEAHQAGAHPAHRPQRGEGSLDSRHLPRAQALAHRGAANREFIT